MPTATITEPKSKVPAKGARKTTAKRAVTAPEQVTPPSAAPEATATNGEVTAKEAAPTAETATKTAARYADAATASQIADRLAKAKEAGFTRPMLMTLSGYTASAIWRAQNGKCHSIEVEFLDALLTQIERGDVKPPQRATTSRASKTTEAVRTLEAALQEKSLATTRKLITAALEALRGKSA